MRLSASSFAHQGQLQRALEFEGADIAACRAGPVCWAGRAALVGVQGCAQIVGAAAEVARVDGRAARQQRVGEGRTAVVLQQTEIGRDIGLVV